MTHMSQLVQFQMTELKQLLATKVKPINSDELAGLLKIHFHSVQVQDLNALIEVYVPKKKQLNEGECLQIVEIILGELSKLGPRTNELTSFYCNSLLKLQSNKIVIVEEDIPLQVNVNGEFKDIVGETFYKNLINYGSIGLMFLKFQEKPHRMYTFFQWVQYNIDLTLNEESDNLYLYLLKQVWSFKFAQIMDTLAKIKLIHPGDKEVSSIEVGLKIFTDIYGSIINNQELKDKFIDRKQFAINFQSEYANKKQQSDFNNHINEIKQQLLFGSNYFLYTKDSFTNKYYYAIAVFLGNREDNFLKEQDQTIQINELSIVDRFFYAKKFYRNQDFEVLKKQLLDNYAKNWILDYIILYGTRKESEQILQNFIDQTNQIEKAAVVSVLLKILLESKIGPKDTKIAFYNKFIKFYQFLLVSIDSGISKHIFDKKCIAIEVERKKKTMNKTFDFNCINCKAKQCLLSMTKRIALDAKQHQLKMKGNNIFSKDQRNQVMYCLDCMQMLPKCSVCLYQITVYNGYAEESKKSNPNQKYKNSGQSLQNALVWCPNCFHGGHFSHIMRWMQLSEKKKCAVYSCKCKCQL